MPFEFCPWLVGRIEKELCLWQYVRITAAIAYIFSSVEARNFGTAEWHVDIPADVGVVDDNLENFHLFDEAEHACHVLSEYLPLQTQ